MNDHTKSHPSARRVPDLRETNLLALADGNAGRFFLLGHAVLHRVLCLEPSLSQAAITVIFPLASNCWDQILNVAGAK